MNAHIIKKPVISEKSLGLAGRENKFTFEVDRRANKNQIKEAIESLYGVDVIALNTITGYRVKKNTGKKRLKSIVAPTKKAIVHLKKGQSINLFDFGGQES